MALVRFSVAVAAMALAASTTALVATPAMAAVPGSTAAVNTDAAQVALHGYDTVAYFTDGAPTKGDARFTAEFGGAKYLFASAANQAKFEANPAAYAPQFGGFCAMGTSFGYKVDADPTAWKIVNDKLYLNYNASVAARWSKDIPGNIGRADENWPKIQSDPQR